MLNYSKSSSPHNYHRHKIRRRRRYEIPPPPPPPNTRMNRFLSLIRMTIILIGAEILTLILQATLFCMDTMPIITKIIKIIKIIKIKIKINKINKRIIIIKVFKILDFRIVAETKNRGHFSKIRTTDTQGLVTVACPKDTAETFI